METTRVLVVDDSLTVRARLVEVLKSDPELEVVGEARDGKEAIESCRVLRPAVITMDMMMPVMTGLSATEYIMAYYPTPILVVSASTNRGELFKTYEALAAGAVDVLEKPTGAEIPGAWERHFLATVKLVSRIRVVTHPRARLADIKQPAVQAPAAVSSAVATRETPEIVAVGASTGGPGAVLTILRALSPAFPHPVLLVMHIAEPFATAFASWLDGQTGIRVSYARDGDLVTSRAGEVIMAPPNRHLIVRGRRLYLTDGAERHSCRPSVDVLFESVAQEYRGAAVGCLLTGMGRDGAAGLLQIRRSGGHTIAQDEATSVVYGMPREAVILDAVDRVLPLDEIGPALLSLAKRRPDTAT